MKQLNLQKSLTLTLGQDFRQQLHTNFVRIEDFANEIKQYQDYHKSKETSAHNSEQIEHSVNGNVGNALKDLDKRVSNLVLSKGKDSLQEVKDARVDNKGNQHPTLYDRLRSDSTEYQLNKDNIMEEVEDAKNTVLAQEFMFDIPNQAWQYLTNLSPLTNSVMQSFHLDNRTGIIYQTQAFGSNYKLSKMKTNGQLLSQMEIVGGGHGTHLGYRWIDEKLWIYTNILDNDGYHKLVRFTYKPNISIKYGEYDMEEVFTGHPELPYIAPIINEQEGLILFRVEYPKSEWLTRNARNYIEIRKIEDIDNHIDKVLYRMDIPAKYSDGDSGQPMQGITFDDENIYWYSGDSDPAIPNFITVFDYKTGQEKYQKECNIGKIGNEFPGNFAEAEGLQMYYDIETGKKALLAGVTVGAPNYRAHQIHGIFMRDVYDKLTAQATPVLMTETGGRTKTYPLAEYTKISDVIEPGYYYLTTSDTLKITDFPVPPEMRDAGWFLEVSASNVSGDTKQVLTRNSYVRDLMKFERMVSIYRLNATDGNTTGWNHVKSSSLNGIAEAVPSFITNMNQLGIITNKRWYIDTSRSSQLKDHPNPGVAGWTCDIESVTANTFKIVLNRVTSGAAIQRYEAYFNANKNERTSPW
ncbi:phage baseplate protein, partial [Staphylococcus warneri]|uniref:phage baseplate protein n=3 Tax=Staphylococcus TaxID=1279 RepID=UPI0009A47267